LQKKESVGYVNLFLLCLIKLASDLFDQFRFGGEVVSFDVGVEKLFDVGGEIEIDTPVVIQK